MGKSGGPVPGLEFPSNRGKGYSHREEHDLTRIRFSEGLAAVPRTTDSGLSFVYVYIDRSGAVALPGEYTEATPFDGGKALVTKGSFSRYRVKQCAAIDRNGEGTLIDGCYSIKRVAAEMFLADLNTARSCLICAREGSRCHYGFSEMQGELAIIKSFGIHLLDKWGRSMRVSE